MAKEYFYNEKAKSRWVPNKIDNRRSNDLFNTRKLHPQVQAAVDQLHSYGWRFFVVNTSDGSSWAMNHHNKDAVKVIAISVVHYNEDYAYFNYVVAHECAHAKNWEDGFANANHGPEFMKALIELCPNEWLHYELGYKARNAASAGITENGYVKPLPKKLTMDDL